MTPEIVLGPPGTGKTTTLIGIVEEELARGVPPDRIGYVSFTRKAATEAAERAAAKFGLERRELRWFRTLHSLCFAALGLTSGDVLEGKKIAEFGDWLGVRTTQGVRLADTDGSTFGYEVGDRALFMENLARVKGVTLREQYEEDSDGLSFTMVKRVADGLLRYKADNGLLDYTDMLAQFAMSDVAPRLEILVVDEAQDLSMLQWRAVERLARGARRVIIGGDDDQCIYRWAGAATDHFIGMRGDVRVLTQSYRCPGVVQDLSAKLVGRVRSRREKEWHARPVPGKMNLIRAPREVDWSGEDILVLVRNAFVAKEYVLPLLEADGIIYEWQAHPSVKTSTLEGILAWETLRRGETVSLDEAKRVYDLMSSNTGVRRGYKTLQSFGQEERIGMADLKARGGLLRDDIWHDALERVPLTERTYLLRARKRGEKLQAKPRVRVSTIHGAKGGEADHVVLMTDVATRTRAEEVKQPDDEARVWYVAVTRAREELTLVSPVTRTYYQI